MLVAKREEEEKKRRDGFFFVNRWNVRNGFFVLKIQMTGTKNVTIAGFHDLARTIQSHYSTTTRVQANKPAQITTTVRRASVLKKKKLFGDVKPKTKTSFRS